MTFTDTALRAALRFYPAAYRRDRGGELAAVFQDTTAGAGRTATLREAFDLAAYGLRVRTGLTSSGLPGRALARAAPFAVGAAAGHASLIPVLTAFSGVPDPGNGRESWLLLVLLSVLPVLALAGALFGRWRPARLLALPTVVVAPVALVLAYWAATGSMPDLSLLGAMSVVAVPAALWTLTVPAAPADLLGRVTWRTRLLMAAALLFGLVQAALPGLFRIGAVGGIAPVHVLVAGLAVLGYVGARRGQVLPLTLLLALAPSALGVLVVDASRGPGASSVLLLVMLLVAAGVAVALRLTRPRGPVHPGGGRAAAE